MTLPDQPEIELFLLGLATLGYLIAWVAYVVASRRGGQQGGVQASTIAWAAWLLHAASFALRTYQAGHLPIYNAYEFSATFAGGIVLINLLFERVHGRRELGVFILPVALALLAHAWMMAKAIEPLIPVFQSLWLKVHILTAFVAYSSFAITFGASCLYLIRTRSGSRLVSRESLDFVDRVAYQAAAIGFLFLSACVVSGAIWAEYVWGRFWSWDPKETWSLITWLIFAAYLHTRYNRGWRERRAALLGVVGFVLVMITYIGVDYLSPRQHAFLFWERL